MTMETNDPELSGKYLGTISEDFVKVAEVLKEASYQIRRRGFSDYPIFPISKDELVIGQVLVGKQEMSTTWNYNVSYLDEFVQRELVEKGKLDDFEKSYRDPDEFCCLFVVDRDFIKFIYIPYPVD